jgi:hypothetical protein
LHVGRSGRAEFPVADALWADFQVQHRLAQTQPGDPHIAAQQGHQFEVEFDLLGGGHRALPGPRRVAETHAVGADCRYPAQVDVEVATDVE